LGTRELGPKLLQRSRWKCVFAANFFKPAQLFQLIRCLHCSLNAEKNEHFFSIYAMSTGVYAGIAANNSTKSAFRIRMQPCERGACSNVSSGVP
jgi:hypothetical protein